ncbi:MAG TPA: dihydrodipicolinate synthase family protein [Mycobacteriales bacterium]|nr:dihydrodipicolinate synthase family protein [Mycobacteriales bacterium]
MPRYHTAEARDWAREHFRGVHNVIIPSYTSDLSDINEQAIRHDVRRNIEFGFAGTLLVSETNITVDEYTRFVEIAADEAKGRMMLIHHAAFNTLQQNIDAANRAAAAGADLALLGYPPSFYPLSERDIYDYTAAFCAGVNLATMLFPVPLWGFERLHPASISLDVLEQLVDEQPNVVAIKAEGGAPSVVGFAHVWARLADRVVISMPIIEHAISLATLLPLRVVATSNTEFYSSTAPTMLSLAQTGKHEEALDLLWQIMPAWKSNESVAPIPGAHVVHRMAWKYQAWLAGYNGGPLRMPTNRLIWKEMRAYRQALVDSNLPVTSDSDDAFFVGRNPA